MKDAIESPQTYWLLYIKNSSWVLTSRGDLKISSTPCLGVSMSWFHIRKRKSSTNAKMDVFDVHKKYPKHPKFWVWSSLVMSYVQHSKSGCKYTRPHLDSNEKTGLDLSWFWGMTTCLCSRSRFKGSRGHHIPLLLCLSFSSYPSFATSMPPSSSSLPNLLYLYLSIICMIIIIIIISITMPPSAAAAALPIYHQHQSIIIKATISYADWSELICR